MRKKILGIIRDRLRRALGLDLLQAKLDVLAASVATHQIFSDPRYRDGRRLLKYGHKIYSQNDEDGIIHEIFERIGTTNRVFIEIGAGDGLENNTLALLLQGWRGAWIEGSEACAGRIREKFAEPLRREMLAVVPALATVENIDSLVRSLSLPREIDLLSIDIDGNDYHIFKELSEVSPRAVVIEYNAKFRPPMEWIMSYNPRHVWSGTDYFGASLKSYEKLFSEKGYALVGCNIAGTNAFFVRADLAGDRFCRPFTAENHYEPARYWMAPGLVSGFPPDFGPFEK